VFLNFISGMHRVCLLLVLVVGLMPLPTVMGACSWSNPVDCITDPIDSVVDFVKDPVGTLEKSWENLNRNVEIVGDCLEDATGCVVEIAKDAADGAKSAVGDIINVAGEITNIEELEALGQCVGEFGDQECNTDSVRERFADGGWNTYYGKRIWDSSVVGAVALAIFPGAQAAAVDKFYSMFEKQMDSVIGVFEDIADDIGGSAADIAYDIVQALIDGDDFDEIFGDVGIKAALLRVTCKNDWCVGSANGDSFFQLGFGWRYTKDDMAELPSIDSIPDPTEIIDPLANVFG
jgi:hypothetical protein